MSSKHGLAPNLCTVTIPSPLLAQCTRHLQQTNEIHTVIHFPHICSLQRDCKALRVCLADNTQYEYCSAYQLSNQQYQQTKNVKDNRSHIDSKANTKVFVVYNAFKTLPAFCNSSGTLSPFFTENHSQAYGNIQ